MGEVKLIDLIGEFSDDQKKILPFLIPLVYAVGYLYSNAYFGSFGIDIKYYTDFYDWIYKGLEIVILCFFLYSILRLGFNENTMSFILNKLGFKGERWGWVVLILFINVINLLFIVLNHFFNLYSRGDFSFIFLFLNVVGFLAFDFKLITNKFTIVVLYTYFFGAISVVSYFSGKIEADQVSKKIINKRVEFKIDGERYSTLTDSLAFIGETGEYLFLLNINVMKTEIFNKNEVEGLKFYPNTMSMN